MHVCMRIHAALFFMCSPNSWFITPVAVCSSRDHPCHPDSLMHSSWCILYSWRITPTMLCRPDDNPCCSDTLMDQHLLLCVYLVHQYAVPITLAGLSSPGSTPLLPFLQIHQSHCAPRFSSTVLYVLRFLLFYLYLIYHHCSYLPLMCWPPDAPFLVYCAMSTCCTGTKPIIAVHVWQPYTTLLLYIYKWERERERFSK